mmetsp:Transcript_23015/g.78383  ORF Transcript_23015/g.78383 Transcript_23015/m.78383 type:complete len:216 (+) Transcript_23015:397-1044(+)
MSHRWISWLARLTSTCVPSADMHRLVMGSLSVIVSSVSSARRYSRILRSEHTVTRSSPSAVIAMSFTRLPFQCCSSRPSTSHTKTRLSSPALTNLEASGIHATAITGSECTSKECFSAPPCASHSFTLWSLLQLTMCASSGLQARNATGAECPLSRMSSSARTPPPTSRHTTTEPSLEADASRPPPLENARCHTSSVCASSACDATVGSCSRPHL